MTTATKLREVLFETLQDVRSGKTDKDVATSVVKLGQTIINSAKVEVDAAKNAVEASECGFLSK